MTRTNETNGHAVTDRPANTPTVEGLADRPQTAADLASAIRQLVRELRQPRVEPELIDIEGLALMLCRSAGSLHRDDAAGRLPLAVRIGGSKRWRVAEIRAWVQHGCPDRRAWAAGGAP